MATNVFDNILELPNSAIAARREALVGFEPRFVRVHANLKMLLDPDGLKAWSLKHHHVELPIVGHMADRHPLVILAGDAGTGKTISAEVLSDAIARELGKEGFFLRLSTRVRGEGLHGQMGNLVNDAFEKVKVEAGKKRLAFLLIDEADAIATSRSTLQMHQEEKAAVNTLIQKLDELRELRGRAVVFMSTNRMHLLDEAIVRRAAVVLQFERPSEEERVELFQKGLTGLKLTKKELHELAELTGPDQNDGLGHSFSDIRLRLIPEAVASCYPDHPLSFAALKLAAELTRPSPAIQ
ncbi:MAG: AAA family ATPase [Flavobacteriales bacterium]|nr:AAA family ATPase [Flavobacteriales bacterium]